MEFQPVTLSMSHGLESIESLATGSFFKQNSLKSNQLSPKAVPRITVTPILQSSELKWNRGILEDDTPSGIRMSHLRPPPKLTLPPPVSRTVFNGCRAMIHYDLQRTRLTLI